MGVQFDPFCLRILPVVGGDAVDDKLGHSRVSLDICYVDVDLLKGIADLCVIAEGGTGVIKGGGQEYDGVSGGCFDEHESELPAESFVDGGEDFVIHNALRDNFMGADNDFSLD